MREWRSSYYKNILRTPDPLIPLHPSVMTFPVFFLQPRIDDSALILAPVSVHRFHIDHNAPCLPTKI